jgi:hypothetical protein
VNIPHHIQQRLELPSPSEKEAIISAADAWPLTHTTFSLSGEEFAEAIKFANDNPISLTILKPLRLPLNWEYLKITNQGVLEGWVLSIPPQTENSPATEVAQALVQAWFQNENMLVGDQLDKGALLVAIADGAKLVDFISRFAWQWLDGCFLLESSPLQPSWVSGRELSVANNARFSASGFARLNYQNVFIEAISEFKAKWRFLSMYRIFEHGYLAEIFETLQGTFFTVPKESLAVASKAVENEIVQFIALVKKAGLENHFKSLFDVVEAQKGAGSNFAFAIERSIELNKQNQLAANDAEKGVIYCYKVRCSIVHAGLTAPIFDAFPDASDFLELILPSVESASLNFLGITILQ